MNTAVIDDTFFAPASTDLINSLFGQYRLQRQRIEQVAAVFEGDMKYVMPHFFAGNMHQNDRHHAPSVERLFNAEGAIKSLDAHYWDEALKLTDVLDVMPKARRDEWFESIRNMTTPEFDEESVRATLADMLSSRALFFAERVDGIFRNLSREHVTNRPEGFSKRMILRNVVNSYGLSGDDQGYINDLRCIIAKFMGRDEPGWNATRDVVEACRRQPGEWFPLDGGALKLRVYMKGTGHLEVHPDMAWRLNGVLASLYPSAIPSQFREPPKRKPKDVRVIERPLPFAVLAVLGRMKDGYRLVENTGLDQWRNRYRHESVPNSLRLDSDVDKHMLAEVDAILGAVGGVRTDHNLYEFDYPPRPVVDLIVTSGCIPDQKSHQFYPTPESLARKAVELAGIEPGHACLEPSAGTGGLLQFMPAGTTAVELSKLHCAVLRERFPACTLMHADFMAIKRPHAEVDRIVMNPPFSEGRWRAHVEHAATLLNKGGRLVAILPESARRARDLLPGMSLQWHGPFDNQFPGTSVSVVLLVAEGGE